MTPRSPLRYVDMTPHPLDAREAHRYRGLALALFFVGVIVLATFVWPGCP